MRNAPVADRWRCSGGGEVVGRGRRAPRDVAGRQPTRRVGYRSATQTYSFLFSDIEGSTRLLRRLGGAEYGRMLAEHHRVIRRALAVEGGREMSNEGDGFFAVFSSPSACLAAAARIQRDLTGTVWPGGVEVRVRIGVHVGEASEHETAGLVGIAVHRAARIAALAHGGQVLCSEAAAALARESLPGGLSLRDLGTYQLKDLAELERVFQLEGEGLSKRFPPLRSPGGTAAEGAATSEAVSPTSSPLRIVIAEDTALLREGLRRLLVDAGFEVVGLAGDAESLLDVVARERPQVVVTDIRMPPTNTTEGIAAAREIRRRLPGTAVLIMSHHVETDQVVELLEEDLGGLGYVLKDRVADVAAFVDIVRRLARGESAIDPEVVSRLVRRSRERSPIDELSEREREVLALMAEGRSNQAIAVTLHMSAKTVETHVGNVFTKLGLLPAGQDHRRVLAVLTYLRR